VTGPTGSGKSTTLYAALNRVHTEEKNIITVEDPVEYQLKGIGQIHVNPKIGLTFASGLRSILRQDPDVIMVGEIRDVETAEIAIQASLTGHLVLSTLHTNDAPSAIVRLIDMGVEPFLVASSLMAVVAQRLVRVICPHCKVSYSPSEAERSYFGNLPAAGAFNLYRGSGCEKCQGKGYLGRTAIFETLIITDSIRQMISDKVTAQGIKSVAVSGGMRTLRNDGFEKVLKGITTVGEVLRVTQKDLVEG
jgi:general secretion pathway protein E